MSGQTLQMTTKEPSPAPVFVESTSANPPGTMTFLLTDIEGSTRLWEESPEMNARVEAHFDALRSAIADTGGEVFSTMGDGVAAAFSSAESAVDAAIRAQAHIESIGLRVRMGINTGEVHRIGHDFRGRAVNRAARIMALGHGGQILLSDITAALVRNGQSTVNLVDLGTHRLRDLSELERVWQIAHPALPSDLPLLLSFDSFTNNLPVSRSSLIGRDCDVARVIHLARRHRLVTLTGVGGVGKSRLAIQTAADLVPQYSSVCFVDLANVADPDDVVETVALTMGAATATDPLAATVALLGSEPALLVVDNCEHVIDAAAAAIDSLLESCVNLTVVATSREALSIDGEHVVAVRPLDPPTTAAALFISRAKAAGLDATSIDRTDVEHICRQLDGIPLAIELAAARAATLGTAGTVSALDNRMGVLNGGRRRTVDRHTTMRATIDWSYRLLDHEEQQLFRWLAVFSNGFELDAAQHVAIALSIDEDCATHYIASLVSKSMISSEPHSSGVRYRMLETMRAYALERLDESGERPVAQFAHADWVTTLTDLPVDDPCSAAVEHNSIRLEREADNWRDAMMFASLTRSSELAGRLCGPPAEFFLLGRHDLADFVRPVLDCCTDDLHARRSVLCALAVSGAGASDPHQLHEWAEEVYRLDEVEPTGLGGLMRWLALAWRGDFPNAVGLCVTSSLDLRLTASTRDMFVGMAVLDHFSLTDATTDPYGLIDRALEVAERSDVAIHRVSCLLGAAWGLADREPERSLQLVRRALDDIPNVPALTRLTLPGSASRLLASLDPQVAARGLLAQLDAVPARRSFVDLIPVFYASSLLHRVEHPNALAALAAISVSPTAPYLSMMDFVDLARRAAATANPISIGELESTVRAGLDDIVSGRYPPTIRNC